MTAASSSVRWAAVGAAVAVTLGAAGIGGYTLVNAEVSSGDRPVFVPITPCRLTDTRPGDLTVGPKTSPMGPAEVLTITAHGDNGECTGDSAIPTDAVALAMNVTALGATSQTFLTFWGDGDNPGTANLNPAPAQPPTPNAVNTPLSEAGTFNVFNERGNVNVVIDVNGYYAHHDHDDLYLELGDAYTTTESDDLYATRESTLSVSVAGAQAVGTAQTFTQEGCAVDANPPYAVILPIDLPVGSEITGGRVSVRSEAASMVEYLVTLYKLEATPTGNAQVIVGATLGADAFNLPAVERRTVDVNPAANPDSNEVLAAGESFYLTLSGTDGKHGLCHAEIDYIAPPNS